MFLSLFFNKLLNTFCDHKVAETYSNHFWVNYLPWMSRPHSQITFLFLLHTDASKQISKKRDTNTWLEVD